MPVLGRVGATALGSAGLASNGAVPLTPADFEAFRMLRTNLAFFESEAPLKSVLVTSGLANEGKSTVAASLAGAAAAAGQSVLLVEADLRRPVLSRRLGLVRSPGLAEYLAGAAAPQEVLQTCEVRQDRGFGGPMAGSNGHDAVTGPFLVCIAAGELPADPAGLLASNRCREFLAKVSKAYDLVILDSSPMLSSVDPLELVPNVDGVVLCVRLGLSTREEVRAVKAAFRRLPERPTGLVVTGFAGGEEEYAYYGYTSATP
jgi:Mrp family chromosome partitioning ATPase